MERAGRVLGRVRARAADVGYAPNFRKGQASDAGVGQGRCAPHSPPLYVKPPFRSSSLA